MDVAVIAYMMHTAHVAAGANWSLALKREFWLPIQVVDDFEDHMLTMPHAAYAQALSMLLF